jgi:hypothetical protein
MFEIARHAYQNGQHDEAIIALEESLALRLFAYADAATLEKWQQARGRAGAGRRPERAAAAGGGSGGAGAAQQRQQPATAAGRPMQHQLTPPPRPRCHHVPLPQGLVLPGSLFRRQKMDLANILVLRSDCLVQLAQVRRARARQLGTCVRVTCAAGGQSHGAAHAPGGPAAACMAGPARRMECAPAHAPFGAPCGPARCLPAGAAGCGRPDRGYRATEPRDGAAQGGERAGAGQRERAAEAGADGARAAAGAAAATAAAALSAPVCACIRGF